MNVIEHVKLKSDSGYIPVRYVVMSEAVGSTLANSNIWIKTAALGIDTLEHLDELKVSAAASNGVDLSDLSGTLGEYAVVTLDEVEPYQTPTTFSFGEIRVGW